ncbi:MAG: DUF6351 family protein [Actinomycetota bacterium]
MRKRPSSVTRLVSVTAALVLFASGAVAQTPPPVPTIEVLSNRADLISGGDALVAVDLHGADPSTVRLTLDDTDVTSTFAVRENGRFEGLLTGLADRAGVLKVTLPDGSGSHMTITNHPIGGPVFSGPQIQPWTCNDGAIDAQCNREPTYEWYYKSTGSNSLEPYDPDNPPDDVDSTTTDNGETVPYIVRVETGAIDRDEYRIAVLFQPDKEWAPWAPQVQWNHKLVITHGASCDTSYAQGSAPDVLNDTALSRGFAVMSHALDNAGHNCNIVTQGEALIMTKELVVETLGEIRYTIGTGCSGGSLVQQQLANAYPGLYQGILPQCSYPDAWSSAMQYIDYDLMLQYFKDPPGWGTGVAWEPATIGFAIGHPNPANPVSFTTVIPNSGKPNRSCPGLEDSQVWHPTDNPDGVRCTLYDYMKNVFGLQGEPHPTWANSPWDNVGVQYGLKPFLAGKITADQFIDLNTKIGGLDHEGQYVSDRSEGDPFAVAAAYRSGAITQANNLDQVAIIDLRGPDPGAFHDVYRTYALRARLEREHGTAANQVLWRGFVALLGDTNFVSEGIIAIDEWLAAVEADKRPLPLAQKIIENRNVADRCTNGAGTELPAAACDAVVQSYSTPRIEAGMPFTDDVMKCELKPLRRSDYFALFFTDAQWTTLQSAFPSGVCDYSKPGQHQQDTVEWQTYQDANGSVVYGGKPLGPAPQSVP